VWIVWVFATLVPHLALVWRRLHDANLAGPWYFLSFVPFGWVVQLVLTALPSNPVGARSTGRGSDSAGVREQPPRPFRVGVVEQHGGDLPGRAQWVLASGGDE
jgi:Predicted membrane protein